MGDIKVKDSSGRDLYTITTDPTSGKVTAIAKGTDAAAADLDITQMENLFKGADLGTGDATWKLDQIFESLGQAVKGAGGDVEVDKTLERLKILGKDVQDLKAMIAAEKAVTPATAASAAKISKLQSILNVAEAQLKGLFAQVKAETLTQAQEGMLASVTANHPGLENAASQGGGKASASSSTPQAGNASQSQFPTAGKAQSGAAGAPFDLQKMLQSSMFQTANLDSLGTLGKNQMDQKKMMQLFMYFAMMAMSGDIGAMTSFMQFITTMILKDKSMQNVNMANKLIELEDASRKATDELLNTPSYDPNNAQVGVDFSKTMEKVKADQGSIATSQKLIAQMMEEFAQVSEFLNNLQKSLLDVRGRILSRVSSFNS